MKTWLTFPRRRVDFNCCKGLPDNIQPIAAGDFNTKGFACSDLHWTDIKCVPKEDIIKMSALGKKGFIKEDFLTPLTGTTYRNGIVLPAAHPIPWCAPCPLGGGRCNGTCECNSCDKKTYFFKGIDTSDCVAFLVNLGIV